MRFVPSRRGILVLIGAGLLQALPADGGWRLRGQAGGLTTSVAVAGTHAYVGIAMRLVVYDVSEPAPREVGATLPFDDFVQDVAVFGGRVYVAAGKSGVHIFDVTAPAQPRRLSVWDSPGSAEGVSVAGEIMYVADGPFGLRIVNVSDPTAPKPMSAAFDETFAFDVVHSGDHAFVAGGGSGLLIVDVTNPQVPIEVSRVDTPGCARRLALSANAALVADQWEGIRVIDVSDRSRPIEIGSLTLASWAMDVAVEGRTVLVATGSSGLVTLDLTMPEAVRQIGSAMAGDRTDSVGVAANGGRAYLSTGRGGFQVFEVSNREQPRGIGSATPLAAGIAAAMSFPYVFVSDALGLKAFDVSDPEVPRETARLAMNSAPMALAVSGSYLYMGTASPMHTLRVVDISQPGTLVEVASLVTPDAAYRDMQITGGLLLAATEFDLALFDVANPREPRLLSVVPMTRGSQGAQAIGVARSGRYAFVAQSEAGVAVVDVGDTAAPLLIRQYKPPGMNFAQAVATDSRYLYVLSCGRLFVADVADPKNPVLSATLDLPVCPWRMVFTPQRLYFAAGFRGFAEVDISHPTVPSFVGMTSLPGPAIDAAVTKGLAVVALEGLGFVTLTADETGAPSSYTGQAPRPEELRGRRPFDRSRFDPSLHEKTQTAIARSRDSNPLSARSVVVTSTADDGPGTLRRALSSAAEGDVISFDPTVFPVTAPAVIRTLSSLSLCASSVTVDASSAGVIIDGGLIAGETFSSGLMLCSSSHDAVVMGLKVINFPGDGIGLDGTDNRIGGDRSRGTGPLGEGNLISGNRSSAISLGPKARGNRIIGNLLGLPPPNPGLRYAQRAGVFFARASGNTLGGSTPVDRNVISGNQINVTFIEAGHNVVIGNYIGTDVTGTRIVPTPVATSSDIGVDVTSTAYDNSIVGNVIAAGQAVVLSDFGSSYNRILRNRIGIGPDGRQIEGLTNSLGTGISCHEPFNVIEGNIIGGMRSTAIDVNGAGDVFVIGNWIGRDPEATEAIPNGLSAGALLLRGARRAFIGGPSAAERNVISGNHESGVQIIGPGTDRNFIIGNVIGATVGWAPPGNGGHGIQVDSSNGNLFQRNDITGNAGIGIEVANGTQNTARRNSISANKGAGIANVANSRLPQPPVITVVAASRVEGTACGGCVIELFSDGEDEGRVYEGSATAAASGAFAIDSRALLRGPFLTVTATDAAGTTSSFSAAVKALPIPPRRRSVRH